MTENTTAPSGGQSDYLDFELEIGLGQGREYPVAVVRSPQGEAHDTMHFPYDELALESRLKDVEIALLRSDSTRRTASSQEEQRVQSFGQALFDALLTGDIRSRYDMSLLVAKQQGKGLRLKLRIQAPALAALPWEFLYDAREAEYLCLMRGRPVVRYLELPQPIQPLSVTPPLRILAMIVSPSDLPGLDVERERTRIEQAIAPLAAQGAVELTWLEGQTWRDLQRAMRGGPWHIFHFVGHGGFDRQRDEGVIVLADEDGKAEQMLATSLGRLLADHDSLRLVLLNSCEGGRGSDRDVFSSTASILVRRGIPAVLAMQYEITDRAAIEFSHAFYESLADGLPVDASATEARKAVSFALPDTMEWGTPVLYLRAPDGRIYDIPRGARPANTPIVKEPDLTPSKQHVGVADKVSAPSTKRAAFITAANVERVVCLRTLTGHTERINGIAFSPDSRLLASASRDRSVRVWQVSDGAALHNLRHTGRVQCVAFSPDGWLLVSGSDDGTVRLWQVAEATSLRTLSGDANRVYGVALSPDSRLVTSVSADSTVRLWRADDGKPLSVLRGYPKDHLGGLLCSVAFSPDGNFLAFATKDNDVSLYRLEGESLEIVRGFTGHTKSVSGIVFSPDSALLAAGSEDQTVCLWRVADGALLKTLRGHRKQVNCTAFSPDGFLLASGSGGFAGVGDNTIRLWHVADGGLLRTIEGLLYAVESVAFSPDGTLLAANSSGDRTIRLWGISEEKT